MDFYKNVQVKYDLFIFLEQNVEGLRKIIDFVKVEVFKINKMIILSCSQLFFGCWRSCVLNVYFKE